MDTNFEHVDPPLSDFILKTLRRLNFTAMTPVQASVIPLLCGNKDVAAEAATGSGKTLAFAIPLLEKLYRRQTPWKNFEIGGLVISPTRELAIQIDSVFDEFLSDCDRPLKKVLIVGGRKIPEDLAALEAGANLIIATPGRFEDLLNRGDVPLHVAVKSLEMLILDEADRLLELGFEKSVNTILGFLPKQRRTGLFSATQTRRLELLIRAGLRNPVIVSVKHKTQTSTPAELINFYKICPPDLKMTYLVQFLEKLGHKKKCIVFFLTCACVEYFEALLKRVLPRFNFYSLHGKMKMKKKRLQVLEKFRVSSSGVLLCTDVMERGIDVPAVDWVVQFDPPTAVSAFVHRCGRTARIGHEGSALTLLMPSEDAYVNFIEKNQKVELKEYDMDCVEDGRVADAARRLQTSDRVHFDNANRAFVSYVRAYSKHESGLLLRCKDLDLPSLAKSFGLIRLPRMPEMKNAESFTPLSIDFNSIAYKDKQKEASRLVKLEEYQATGVWPTQKALKRKQSMPWSEAKQTKSQQKEKRSKKREYRQKKIEEGKTKTKRRKKKISEEQWAELEENIAFLKKTKKNQDIDLDCLD